MRCNMVEDEMVTLSWFMRGLNEDVRKELVLREATTLDQPILLSRIMKWSLGTNL
jgi:hypothetical protein